MLFGTKKDRVTEEEYCLTILLHYLETHNEVDEYSCYPAYFKEELKLGDIKGSLNKLIKKGYVSRTGNDKFFVTESGKDYLNLNYDYISFFNLALQYISVADYKKAKDAYTDDKGFEEILISLLSSKIKSTPSEKGYLTLQNMRYDTGVLYENIGEYSDALKHYLTSLYFIVSGMKYYNDYVKYKDGRKTKKNLEASFDFVCMQPHVTAAIIRLKSNFDKGMTDEIYKETPIAFNMCTQEKFSEIVESLFEGTFNDSQWQESFWDRFRKKIG